MHSLRSSLRSMLAGLALALALALAASPVRADTPRLAADQLTALADAGIAKPLRRQPGLRWGGAGGAAWTRFVGTAGGSWSAAWDAATGVPNRIWGSGIRVPGATASPEIAARVARQVLADHIVLLAPGSTAADFELVANQRDGRIRSVGFVQRAGGHRVVGGQVSFRFAADRLFVIASEALPDVSFSAARSRLDRPTLHARVAGALRDALALPRAAVASQDDDVVLPMIGDAGVLGYRLCTPVVVDGGAGSQYAAYVDPGTGAVIAVRDVNVYATGTVLYRVVDRHPGRGRTVAPAARAFVAIDGTAAITGADGGVTWPGDAAGALVASARGDLVTVVNHAAGGAAATAAMSVVPGGAAVWDASQVEVDDAQVNVFHGINVAKQFVRTRLDPRMPGLDAAIVANVNVAQDCNAYFDGAALNFLRASPNCRNTGLVQDVVFHEYGHVVHKAEVIPGVGAIDRAMGEGAADFLAASITNDSGVGRGFNYTDAPVRDLDPAGTEATWPRDIGEIHRTGLIYAGALWDLRTAAIAAMGEASGIDFTLGIYLATLRRASNIPTALVEALAADDDDGDLANGTPHECLIRAAFGRHGLHTATAAVDAPGAVGPGAPSATVGFAIAGLSPRCSSDAIQQVTVTWLPPPGSDAPAAGQAPAAPVGPLTFQAPIPLAPSDSVTYRASVALANGSSLAVPDNPADPSYQLYQGATIPLYCTSFDTDPFASGWSTGTSDGRQSPWRWGPPTGGAWHPPAAYTGASVLAQAPSGTYPSSSSSYVTLPTIHVASYSDVRLQYRRWLTVEDGRFDTAAIEANGTPVWRNTITMNGNLDHIDREWRFHDVPLSGWFFGHDLTVRFALTSDEGIELGGWTLDDLCIVANPQSVCGDGIVSPTEECDDGAANADRPDACRTFCRRPACGDGIVDRGEECDGGDDCSPFCQRSSPPPPAGGGCQAGRGSSGGLTLMVALGGALLGLTRRRRVQ